MTRSKAITKSRKQGFQLPKTVRTLGLPRDFQIVVAGREVRAARANRPFVVVSRTNPSFRVRVPRVRHTLGAFVRWLLWRYKKQFGVWSPTKGEKIIRLRPIRLSPFSPPLLADPFSVICFLWAVTMVLRMVSAAAWRGFLQLDFVEQIGYFFPEREPTVTFRPAPYRPFTRRQRRERQEDSEFNRLMMYVGYSSDDGWTSL